jgi:hypothetical protein
VPKVLRTTGGFSGVGFVMLALASGWREKGNHAKGVTDLGGLGYSLRTRVRKKMLHCTECISDARIGKWVQSSIRASLGKGFTEAQITATSDCTAKNFLTNFRAKPYLIDERAVWTLSVGPCEKTILNIRQ